VRKRSKNATATKRIVRESSYSNRVETGRRSILYRNYWRNILRLRVRKFFKYFVASILYSPHFFCSEFFKRTILLNSLVWTCAATGRSGLTYEVSKFFSKLLY